MTKHLIVCLVVVGVLSACAGSKTVKKAAETKQAVKVIAPSATLVAGPADPEEEARITARMDLANKAAADAKTPAPVTKKTTTPKKASTQKK